MTACQENNCLHLHHAPQSLPKLGYQPQTVPLLQSHDAGFFHARAGRIGSMEERRWHGGYGVLVACTIFLALIAAYIGGYFGLGVVAETQPSHDFPYRYIRLYPYRW